MLISGFWHEHERYDRDNYVKINFENIQEEEKINFQKREEEYCETFEKDVISKIPYDYCSLMHYGKYAAAHKINLAKAMSCHQNVSTCYLSDVAEPTIEPLKSMKELECKNIGQHEGLSKLDLQKINLLYNCKKKCSNERSFWLNSWVQCSAEHRLIYELTEF